MNVSTLVHPHEQAHAGPAIVPLHASHALLYAWGHAPTAVIKASAKMRRMQRCISLCK